MESGINKTQRQVRSLVATFVEMIGDDHVRSLAQSRFAEYRSLLLALPRTYGKGQQRPDIPLWCGSNVRKLYLRRRLDESLERLTSTSPSSQEVLVDIKCVANIFGVRRCFKALSKKEGCARDERNPFSRGGPDCNLPATALDRMQKSRKSRGTGTALRSRRSVNRNRPWLYTLARREELCGLVMLTTCWKRTVFLTFSFGLTNIEH